MDNKPIDKKTTIITKKNQSYMNYGMRKEYIMRNSNNSTCVDIKINEAQDKKLISKLNSK